VCKVRRPLPFEQNHTRLSYKQNSSDSLHLVRGKDLDRTVLGIKLHVRRGPCASHKALAPIPERPSLDPHPYPARNDFECHPSEWED